MSELDSSLIEPLPTYVQNQLPQSPVDAVLTRISVSTRDPNARVILESFIESQKAPAYNGSQEAEPPKPIEEYPTGTEPLTLVKQQIVAELFRAIRDEESGTISLLIQNNLVTANTKDEAGRTPLLEAISTKIIHLVKELLDFGADPNAFGVIDHATRTPLMFAASTGSLPIVKLLFEPPYSANDALVSTDGQIALRLASAGGHRAIVEYLPSRRAGGFLRWKTYNAAAIARMKAALRSIGSFIKFFVWTVPKFFVWSIPKHLVVLPVVRSCKWCWANRKRFGGWCKHQIVEMPKRVVRAGKWVWKGVKKIPKGIKETTKVLWKGVKMIPKGIKETAKVLWEGFKKLWKGFKKIPKAIEVIAKELWKLVKEIANFLWELVKEIPKVIKATVKALWKFGTHTLPRWIKKLALWFWDVIAVRIPKAIVIVAKWIWAGISSLGKAAWNVILKMVSFLDTILQAIVTFLRNVRLRDVWNGFCDILRAIFITLPTTLWSWIERFGVASFEVMRALFGWFGEFLWWIAVLLKRLVFYIPSELWIVLQSLGGSIARGWSELMVYINPKM